MPARRHPSGLLHRWTSARGAKPRRHPHARCKPPLRGCRSCLSPRAAAPITGYWSSPSSQSRHWPRSRSSIALLRARARRGPAWDCGFPDPSPATQYTADSFAQPIRRVFGEVVFLARERVDMPAPGDARPARLTVTLRDPRLGRDLCSRQRRRLVRRRAAQLSAVPDHSPIPEPRVRRSRRSPVRSDAGDADMVLILELIAQGAQMMLGAHAGAAAARLSRARSRRVCCAGADRRFCSPTATCCA